MKKITILFMLITMSTFAQIGLPEERASLAIFADPHASYKENSLDVGVEFGYQGVIYAKVQLEILPALTGGYTSFGGAIGANVQVQDTYIYTGVRLVPWVWRNGDSNPLFGVEGGVNYYIGERTYVGLRATYDYREDMKLLNYPVKWVGSGFIKLGSDFDL